MATTVVLVRHCAHDLADRVLVGRQPVALNKTGIEQAERLARTLRSRSIGLVFSSPQRRAIETADRIAQAIGRPADIAPDFDELEYGQWTGRPFAALQGDPGWCRWNSSRSQCRPPGGETIGALLRRVRRGIADVALAYPGERVAIVTHAEAVRVAILTYRRMPIDAFAGVRVDLASCTTLQIRGRGATVIQENAGLSAMAVPA